MWAVVAGWGLDMREVSVRVAELHDYRKGGSLPDMDHYDKGSLVRAAAARYLMSEHISLIARPCRRRTHAQVLRARVPVLRRRHAGGGGASPHRLAQGSRAEASWRWNRVWTSTRQHG